MPGDSVAFLHCLTKPSSLTCWNRFGSLISSDRKLLCYRIQGHLVQDYAYIFVPIIWGKTIYIYECHVWTSTNLWPYSVTVVLFLCLDIVAYRLFWRLIKTLKEKQHKSWPVSKPHYTTYLNTSDYCFLIYEFSQVC